jgi:hypothetical protein
MAIARRLGARGAGCLPAAHSLKPSAGKHSKWRRSWLRLAVMGAIAAFMVCALIIASAETYYLSIVREGSVEAVPVDGTVAKYTIVLMSYPKRLRSLRTVVNHFGRCPSVAEIVVVWDGSPPPTGEDLQSAAPVRIRTESAFSLNNRFKPDPLVRTQAILSLDDDTLLRCADIERAFAKWRRFPEALVGFFPRLTSVYEPMNKQRNELFDPYLSAEASSSASETSVAEKGVPREYLVADYLGERDVYRIGQYNVLLTPAMFYDSRLMMEYWHERYLWARKLVDDIFNCEDILMNFVATLTANQGKMEAGEGRVDHGAIAALHYVRARRRLDLSQLTGAGISHAGRSHMEKRRGCAAAFAARWGELPKVRFNWTESDAGPPLCSLPGLGCVYL